jgi:hypothetical protein
VNKKMKYWVLISLGTTKDNCKPGEKTGSS